MLTGLGRQLRCCGVDVRLVDADTSHEAAAAVCLSPRYWHDPGLLGVHSACPVQDLANSCNIWWKYTPNIFSKQFHRYYCYP